MPKAGGAVCPQFPLGRPILPAAEPPHHLPPTRRGVQTGIAVKKTKTGKALPSAVLSDQGSLIMLPVGKFCLRKRKRGLSLRREVLKPHNGRPGLLCFGKRKLPESRFQAVSVPNRASENPNRVGQFLQRTSLPGSCKSQKEELPGLPRLVTSIPLAACIPKLQSSQWNLVFLRFRIRFLSVYQSVSPSAKSKHSVMSFDSRRLSAKNVPSWKSIS